MKRVAEIVYDGKWRELRKQAIMTSEAGYWNQPLWQVKRVTEAKYYDKWSELLT